MATGVKTGGRTKGTPNKTTNEIREYYQFLITNNLDKLNEDLNTLEPLQRLKMIIELSKFVVPTLKATDITTDKENGFNPIVINLGNGISHDEVKRINSELEAKY
jgi:predicted AAA+ superfamily ATPase